MHTAGSRYYFRSADPFFSTYTALRAIKETEEVIETHAVSPDKVVSPQIQWAQFFKAFILPECTHAARTR